MKPEIYRMASWWLQWEDLLFPEPGTEEKVVRRAAKFASSGIDTVVIFGGHFRWDFISNWDRFHHLLEYIVTVCHREGIRVFDHHSATLVHRADSLAEYRAINEKNRHHVPFFPSREFADCLTFHGHKLNDFRMRSVRDGLPCYLSNYNAEIFCMNNLDFVAAYQQYLLKLLPTGIDGLMCDDVIYYPGWDGCGCSHCRNKFKSRFGWELPAATDESFWGNYESPAFKDWLTLRYHDPLDFLAAVRDTVGCDFPLMSCCSGSSSKHLDSVGMTAEIMSGAMNHLMLEICGEMVSGHSGMAERVSDMLLHKAIAQRSGIPNIGLGYAHNPDSAFLVWAFNKLFASSPWISTLTGRFGVAEEIRKTIPDEADIIREAYIFEKHNGNLFCGESTANLAVLFSRDNLMFNGCGPCDYSQPWHDLTSGLFRQNIPFDVVVDIPCPDRYPVLLLCNFDCVSKENAQKLQKFRDHGGTIVATGPLGFRDERGVTEQVPLLSDLGAECRTKTGNSKLPAATLFAPSRAPLETTSSTPEILLNGIPTQANAWLHSGSLHWLPQTNPARAIAKVEELLPTSDPVVACPKGWTFRVMHDTETGRTFVHLLVVTIRAIPYQDFRDTHRDEPVIEKLLFEPTPGIIRIRTSSERATLNSPDIPAPLSLQKSVGTFTFRATERMRYLIVELS